MKTLFVMLLSLTLSVSASAQRHFSRGHIHPATRVYVVPSVSFFGGWGISYPYGYYGYPFSYYNYPFYAPRTYRSAKAAMIDQQISSIKSDYKYKIKAVRSDKELSRAEKRQQILTLKSERENEIQKAQTQFLNNEKQMSAPSAEDKPNTSGSMS